MRRTVVVGVATTALVACGGSELTQRQEQALDQIRDRTETTAAAARDFADYVCDEVSDSDGITDVVDELRDRFVSSSEVPNASIKAAARIAQVDYC